MGLTKQVTGATTRWPLPAEEEERMRRGAFRAVAGMTFAVAVTALCAACSSGSSQSQLVAECVDYQNALVSCFHRSSSVASQPALLAKNDDDRARIGAMCSENLARLRTSCR
jgi:hypothetical protein